MHFTKDLQPEIPMGIDEQRCTFTQVRDVRNLPLAKTPSTSKSYSLDPGSSPQNVHVDTLSTRLSAAAAHRTVGFPEPIMARSRHEPPGQDSRDICCRLKWERRGRGRGNPSTFE